MLEKLITELLNKYLGQYIEDLDKQQLDITLVSGKVVLENVKLKSTIFEGLPVPFQLAYGQVGLIKIKIPLWKLFIAPIEIEISDVFALVRPKLMKDWKPELELEDFKKQNQNKLENFEKEYKSQEELKKKDSTLMTKLQNVLIDNIQISLKNVYIRYEDTFSEKQKQNDAIFSIGILLKEFSVFTARENWSDKGVLGGKEYLKKVVSVKDFSFFLDYQSQEKQTGGLNNDFRFDVEKCRNDQTGMALKDFLDQEFKEKKSENKLKRGEDLEVAQEVNKTHNYLLDTFAFEARIGIDKRRNKHDKPEIDVNILFGGKFKYFEAAEDDEERKKQKELLLTDKADLVKVQFGLKQTQIMRILQIVQYIGYYNEFQKNALKEIKERMIQKEEADRYMNLYIKWKCYSQRKSKQELSKDLKKELEKIEMNYTFEKLTILRKYGMKMIENEQERITNLDLYNQKMEEKKKELTHSKGTWLNPSYSMNEDELEEYRKDLAEELNINEDNQNVDWSKEINDLSNELKVENVIVTNDQEKDEQSKDEEGKEIVRYIFSINMPLLNLSFFNEFEQPIFQSSIKRFFAYAEIGDNFQRVQLSIDSLYLDDYWSGASSFPRIIDCQPFVDSDTFLTELKANKLFYQLSDKQALIVRFDMGKKDQQIPFKIQIETQKTLFVNFNPYFVKELIRTIYSSTEGEDIDLTYYKETMIEQALIGMEKARELLLRIQQGLFNHVQFDVNIQIHGPVLIIPMDVFDSRKSCLILDTGIIRVKSFLLKHDKQKVYKKIMNPAKLYDRYEASLEAFQISMMDHSIHKDFIVKKNPNKKSIIEEFNSSLIILNCHEPQHHKFPTIEIIFSIPNIQLMFCQSLLEKIMKITNNLMDSWNAQEYNLMEKISKGERLIRPKSEEIRDDSEYELMNKLRLSIQQQLQEKKKKRQDEQEKLKQLKEIYQNSYLLQLEYELKKANEDCKMDIEYQEQQLQRLVADEEKNNENKESQVQLRLYIQITKFQLDLMDDDRDFMKLEVGQANFMKIQMLNLEVEIELDGTKNLTTNMCVYKLFIQDIQSESKIKALFRMLLSNPTSIEEWHNYEQRVINSLDPQADYKDFIVYQSNPKAYLQNSTLYKLQHQKWRQRQNEIEKKRQEIKQNRIDNPDQKENILTRLQSTEPVKQKEFGKVEGNEEISNELEFHFYKKDKEIFSKATLSDMRLIFTMPTLQKIVKTQIGINELFEDLDEKKYQSRRKYLSKFEYITQNIRDDFANERSRYYKKVFTNFFQTSGLPFGEFKEKTFEGIREMFKLWQQERVEQTKLLDIQELNEFNNQKKLELVKHDSDGEEITDQDVEKEKKADKGKAGDDKYATGKTKKKIVKEKDTMKMQVFGFLRNFSVWIPMNAYDENTSIMSLSFNSEASYISDMILENIYEEKFHALLKKHILNKQDEIGFKLQELTMQNLTVIPKKFLQNNFKNTEEEMDKVQHKAARLLKPCNIDVKIVSIQKALQKYWKNDINVYISPIKLQVGFRQIDFANQVMIKVEKLITKQYQKSDHKLYLHSKPNKSCSELSSDEEYQKEDEKQMEDKRKDEQIKLQKKADSMKAKAEKKQPTYKLIVGFKEKKETRINNIDVQFDGGVLIQLIDEDQYDQPLINVTLEGSNLTLRSHRTQDDAASYILKKMGIYQKRHPQSEIEDTMAINLKTQLKLDISYYNQRNLCFEPLVEPWNAELLVRQDYAFTELNVTVQSLFFFNINFTFGGAETLAKIMKRMDISQKEAKRLSNILEDKELTEEEEIDHEEYLQVQQDFMKRSVAVGSDDKKQKQKVGQLGYEFKNFTGIPIKFTIHDDTLNSNLQQAIPMGDDNQYQVAAYTVTPLQLKDQEGREKDHPRVYMSHEEAEERQKEITTKMNRGREVETLEIEPLSIDIKIEDSEVIRNVEVETLGVFGYIGYIQKELVLVNDKVVQRQTVPEDEQVEVPVPLVSEMKKKKKSQNLFKKLATKLGIGHKNKKDEQYEELRKAIKQQNEKENLDLTYMSGSTFTYADGDKKKIVQRFGVICNVQMNGQYKQVNIESQLLFVNNLNIDLQFFCKSVNQQVVSNDQMFQIKSGASFRAPLTWFIHDEPMQLFLEDPTTNVGHIIFNDIQRIFRYNLKTSQLSSENTKVLNYDKRAFISVDVSSYACIKQSKSKNPLQYLVAFNPPLIISNFNFCALQLKSLNSEISHANISSNSLLAVVPPSESFNVYDINPVYPQNLNWTFFETGRTTLQLHTAAFEVNERKDQSQTEEFLPVEIPNHIDHVNIEMEMKRVSAKMIESYNSEKSFEFRKKVQDFTSSQEIILYPRFMVVNKNTWPIICKKQEFAPKSNTYLNIKGDKTKVRFSMPGYGTSDRFNVNTTGLSGDIEVNIKEKGVKEVKLPQHYAPEKIEMGLYIKAATFPFKKTTIVTVAPRFVISNLLQRPIVIKQVNQREQIFLEPSKDYQVFNFEKKDIEQIQVREVFTQELTDIRAGNGVFQAVVENKSVWSGAFQIEDLDDFQISYLSEQSKDQEDNWFEPTEKNGFLRFSRVIVTSKDDATIHIIIGNPIQSDFLIENKTEQSIQFVQMKSDQGRISHHKFSKRRRLFHMDDVEKHGRSKILGAGEILPYTAADLNEPKKKLILRIDHSDVIINMDKALKKKIIKGESGQYYCFQLLISSVGKKLKVSNSEDPHQLKKKENNRARYLNTLLKRRFGGIMSLNFKMKGIGISIMDETPKELFFFTLYGLEVTLKKQLEARKNIGTDILEYLTSVRLYVDHVQLDNQFNNKMPVIMAPKKELKKREFKVAEAYQAQDNNDDSIGEEKMPSENKRTSYYNREQVSQEEEEKKEHDEEEGQNIVPFIQAMVGYSQGIPERGKFTQTDERISSLQFSIQQLQVQIDTEIIDKVLKYVDAIVKVFNKDEKNPKFNKKRSIREGYATREVYCDLLKADDIEQIDPSKVQNDKMYIEFMNLGPLKAIISFKYEKKQLDFDIDDPNKRYAGTNMLNGILKSVSSVTNSPLSFRQLILVDTYASPEMLMQRLQKNYMRQGILQFYKILGASDLIGNPLGLVDKLGTGVFELFSEPVEGALKGPEDFVGGVGKGVQSLVSNVIAGSFDSVSKISGSLYTLVKGVQGESGVSLKRPDHVFDGIYLGLKGAAKEIGYGVAGVVKKPMEGSQEKGVGGTFKGIGQGVFGLVACPVTAALRLGSSVTQGVSATATKLGQQGKDVSSGTYARFRPPRYINTKTIIKPYNEEFSLIHFMLADIRSGAYDRDTLKYYCVLPETKQNGELVGTIAQPTTFLVVTNQHVFYIKVEETGKKRGMAQLLFKKKTARVKLAKLYEGYQNDFELQREQHISRIKIFKRLRKRRLQKKENIVEKSLVNLSEEFYCLVINYKTRSAREEKKKYKFVGVRYFDFFKVIEILSLNPRCLVIDETQNPQINEFDEQQNPQLNNQMEQEFEKINPELTVESYIGKSQQSKEVANEDYKVVQVLHETEYIENSSGQDQLNNVAEEYEKINYY